MKREQTGQLIYSPSDLVTYLKSPFASWMSRYNLENPGAVTQDVETEDERLIARTGDDHERAVLGDLKLAEPNLVEVSSGDPVAARLTTLAAIKLKAPIIYQAALGSDNFAGFADFLVFADGKYQVWDTKLARSPKAYYAVQLCCYSEMLAAVVNEPLATKFGIILGAGDRVEFRVEDFIHYYRSVRASFLELQDGFSGDVADRPEPLPRADHGRWTSHATAFFTDTDHLVQVAGISIGQIKKLKREGIATVADLAGASGRTVRKLAVDSMEKLVSQARLQYQTRFDRIVQPDAPPRYEVLPHVRANGESVGLGGLPAEHRADVFFDMEGYPLVPGGLEYLFGVCARTNQTGSLDFKDWWAHDREEEKLAFEGFVDWVHARWVSNPGMHIYHYAAYEVSAVRRLSTRHETRQDQVDDLLRNDVFVDLYQIVRHGLRIGEDSYSIKKVERLYRPERATDVTTAVDSIVEYARWIESGQGRDWTSSPVLRGIRDYNEDDCRSNAELTRWLRSVASENNIYSTMPESSPAPVVQKELSPEVIQRLEIADKLREQSDIVSLVLADLIDFHRREEKPMWWRMFDRAAMTLEELRDDPGCIAGIQAVGAPEPEKRSLVQTYRFDPAQECKLAAGGSVMFSFSLDARVTLSALDTSAGELQLRISPNGLADKFGGAFPQAGSLIPHEHVSAGPIQKALTEVCAGHLSFSLHPAAAALLNRDRPCAELRHACESDVGAAVRVADSMSGGCLVIQGPPGTGKTFTASHVITALLAQGKRVGVTSNSHKVVVNLLAECGEAARGAGATLRGMNVGGEEDDDLHSANPSLIHVESSSSAFSSYAAGIVGGTAWLFTRPEWEDALDFLFIDEAGQVSLANAVAMARCAKNLVLLGDQMQLEQPVQGSHPGDSGLSALQYALKDTEASKPDSPVFHAVVPRNYGLFLGKTFRMHPDVCCFISESIYEERLGSHPDCANQKVSVPLDEGGLVTQETGIVFSGIAHDGDIQRSDEEVERVKAVYEELLGRTFTAKDKSTRPLQLDDFLFVAPYNAQVRALKEALPPGARVGSVDRFQGQEAPVCILSLCSSYGEYGSRGLGFILDRNRINVAVSRAQCLAVVVADPRIASAPAGSIEEMKLLNLFCKLAASGAVARLAEPAIVALSYDTAVAVTVPEAESVFLSDPVPREAVSAAVVIDALGLPTAARVDLRVPKRLLVENGAPTSADKKHINEGVEYLTWIAALKPTTIGVPEYRDDVHEYVEIALIAMTLRADAKATRITELVHRAIPYPVFLLVEQGQRTMVSLAHKRRSQGEAGKTVLDGDVISVDLDDAADANPLRAFLDTLALVKQPRASIHALYQGWIDTIVALQSSRITGEFLISSDSDHAAQRSAALAEVRLLETQIANLRSSAAKERQLPKRVQINFEIRRLQDKLADSRSRL